MRNLRRRIEALEGARTAARENRQLIANNALVRLWPPQLEQLISACGAEREGRELSGDESAAKQAYTQALIGECGWAGYPSTEGFEGALDIRKAIPRALRVSDEELKLAIRAMEALEEGRTASPEETAALQTWDAEWARLWRLAGFRDVQEDSAR